MNTRIIWIIFVCSVVGQLLIFGTPEDFNSLPPHEPSWARPVNLLGFALSLPAIPFGYFFGYLLPSAAAILVVFIDSLAAAAFWGFAISRIRSLVTRTI